MQIATGVAASEGAGGAGAVIFDSTIDPLTMQLYNMEALKLGAQEREADSAKFIVQTQAMQKAFTPDVNQKGAWSGDRAFLTQKAQELQQAGVDAMKVGTNPFNPGSGAASLKYQNLQAQYDGYLNSSIQSNQWFLRHSQGLITDGGKTLDAEESNKNLAAPFVKPLDQRGDPSMWGNPLVPVRGNADEAIEKFTKTFADQENTTAFNKNGLIGTTETKSKPGLGNPTGTPEQQALFKDNALILANDKESAKSLRATWSALPITAQSSYIQQAKSNGADVNTAPQKAYEAWVADRLQAHLTITKKDNIHGESEAAKIAAKKQASSDDQVGFVKEVASVFTGSSLKPITYTPPGRKASPINGLTTDETTGNPTNMFGTTMLNTVVDLGKFTYTPTSGPNKGKSVSVPNHITFAGYNPNDPTHSLQIATVESEKNYAEGLSKSAFTGSGYPTTSAGFLEAIRTLGNKIPKSGKEEGLDPLTGATEYSAKFGHDPFKIDKLTDAQKAQVEAMRNGKVIEVPLTGVAKTVTQPKATAQPTTTEKMYVVDGKAYKQSALAKQGYDVTTLTEYKP